MSYTDFHKYSHGELRKMVQALNSGEVMAASDPWRRAHTTLKAIRASLTKASTEAAVNWEGTTSDAFHARMLHLAATINNAASYANDAAITLQGLAEAIDKAKREMPEEPSNWEKFKDGVGDTVSSAFGGDDKDTKNPVANQKRAEAVAVMQTLALKYRTAAPMLKPVTSVPEPKWKHKGDERESPVVSEDSSSSAAIGALVAGTGQVSTGTGPQRSSAPKTAAPKAAVTSSAASSVPKRAGAPLAPTDPGIKGGTPQAVPKPLPTKNFGPGTGPDSTNVTLLGAKDAGPTPTGTGPATNPTNPVNQSTNNPGQGLPMGPGGTQQKTHGGGPPKAGDPLAKSPTGVTRNGPGQSASRSNNTFGPTGMPGGALGKPGGDGRTGGKGGVGRHVGTVVGEGDHAAGRSGAKRSFTEGGSGVGVRGRLRGDVGTAGAAAGFGPGMPAAGAQRRKKEEEERGKRPDYLVEDEETWASDKPRNPNMVE